MTLVRFDAANADGAGQPPGNTWVLREEEGSVIALDADDGRTSVEAACDYCGRYGTDVAPTPAGDEWRCYGGTGPCANEAVNG
jgi:hypothetical protein